MGVISSQHTFQEESTGTRRDVSKIILKNAASINTTETNILSKESKLQTLIPGSAVIELGVNRILGMPCSSLESSACKAETLSLSYGLSLWGLPASNSQLGYNGLLFTVV